MSWQVSITERLQKGVSFGQSPLGRVVVAKLAATFCLLYAQANAQKKHHIIESRSSISLLYYLAAREDDAGV
jgi:hypothetical protein